MLPLALAAASLAAPCSEPAGCAAACCYMRAVTFHGPYLPALFAGGPGPAPDTLPGTPPYLAPAPAALGFALPPPTPVKNPAATKSDPLPPSGPFRFGPTGVPPRLGPGPWTEPEWVELEPLDFPEPLIVLEE